jgi:hypothetical protein
MRKYLILVPLLALLAVSIWFAVHEWSAVEGPPLPLQGKIAMGLGIFFSIVIGCGLMALVFYSSRHGYDEAAHYDPPSTRDES